MASGGATVCTLEEGYWRLTNSEWAAAICVTCVKRIVGCSGVDLFYRCAIVIVL